MAIKKDISLKRVTVDNREKKSKHRWDVSLYDNKHSFVWKYGEELIELLSPRKGERILDLGCGTGHLTHKLAASGAKVVGIDSDPEMIAEARKSYPDLQFKVADGSNFHFPGLYAAVFSNAALHWIKEPERAIASVWSQLKPEGRFVAEFGGKGNVQAIIDAISRAIETFGYPQKPEDNPWYFPSVGEYSTLLEKQGFLVEYAALFDRLTPLDGAGGMRDWIDMFGNVFLQGIPTEKRIGVIKEIENQLRSRLYRNGTWFADYKRIRVVAVKAGSPGKMR